MTIRVWGVALSGAVVLALAAVAVAGEVVVHTRDGAGIVATGVAVVLGVVATSWFAVGAYLAIQRPHHPLGWLFIAVGGTTQVGVTGEVAERAGWLSWTSSPAGVAVDGIAATGMFLLFGLLPLLYPHGTLASRASRIVAAVTVAGALASQAQVVRAMIDPAHTWPFGPPPADGEATWTLWLPWAVYLTGAVAGWVLCVARLTGATHPLRQQLAWLLLAVIAVMVTAALGDSLVAMALQAVALLSLPAAIAVGIVQYRLLDIDTAVPRAVTAGIMATAIAGVYVAVAAATGARLTGTTLPSVLAAAGVAVLLLPLHTRVSRIVDRAIYGKRADPLRTVADLSSTVETDGEDLLEALLREITTTFGAGRAVIRDPDGGVVASAGQRPGRTPEDAPRSTPDAGAPGPAPVTVDLTLAGVRIGELELIGGAATRRYTASERALLEAIAGIVALTVRATGLADELEAQRDAVVAAAEGERHRLRRDLHDGLGPSLTGLRLGLQALGDSLDDGDGQRARRIADVLHDESERAVTEVRRIVDALRPTELERADLATALRDRFDAGVLPVTVIAADVPALAPSVEVAAFRVVEEAVANARRHANATTVTVGLAVTGDALVASVSDDGTGIADGAAPGVGLASMRARAEQLGGTLEVQSSSAGTVVIAALPLAPTAAPTEVAP
ncbi:sensor histidine kinase [Demequina sp. NBRC 110056]|uniref:sensor histidine kinase n=1 Tax=Demequina sp. NBRC 110056 TaxID=1570345 RepID=UPI000A07B990|nr:sensor histidine kinase [Demequina sp. NBRC 110056]